MFRKMRRFKQQIPDEECRQILRDEWRGVLSLLGDEGYPYGIPIDFWYDEQENKIFFHGAGQGHKIDAIRGCDKASFCVMDQGYRKEGEWALNIRSVIAFGRIRELTDPEDVLRRTYALGKKYYPDQASLDEEMRKAAARVHVLELTIEHMTGKLVNES